MPGCWWSAAVPWAILGRHITSSSPADSPPRHLAQRLSGQEFGVGHSRTPLTQGDQHPPGQVLPQLLALGTFATFLEPRTSAALCASCLPTADPSLMLTSFEPSHVPLTTRLLPAVTETETT
jgi:hypothetical protein